VAQLHDILIRPLVTEKTAKLSASENVYTFEVGLSSNKIEIQRAIQEVFGVRVESVRTLVVRGKARRFGRFSGKRSNWKKAYVRLAAGDSLNFLES